ncbi:signal recognition particle subunit [Malassezia caprae]|uniref:Signal recognition particle subunit n=1 Tax=Malassezia caprae TaxID=1381934 RepID=A0AAF0IWA9_9BASI|nr:signal recognition particle subunit [Malassezia caprae]
MPGEEFDDDFEFDLPDAPPVPTGGGAPPPGMPPAQMEMMQQMMQQMSGGGPPAQPARQYPSDVVMDGDEDGPHKHWTTVYPIYVDAKRRYRHGCRRVAYEKAVLFPNSLYLANAAKRLQLEYKHEVCLIGSQQPNRAHPQDWENPGRIKVRLFGSDGRPLHTNIPTKQKLIEAISELLQSKAGGPPPPLTERRRCSQQSSRAALRPRQRLIRQVPFPEQLPPHSPAHATGLLNMDMAKMPGADALKSMGPLGSMMSSMGLGDDEDEETPAAQAPAKAPPALGRRQRKRVLWSSYNCGQQGHVSSACTNEAVPKTCFRCNETGHVSRDCPQAPAAAAGGECYRCGMLGHMARACPRSAGASRGGRSCYNCGGIGHLSRDCPSAAGSLSNAGPKCYNCGNQGHISRDCEQPPQRSCYTCGAEDHFAAHCPQAV